MSDRHQKTSELSPSKFFLFGEYGLFLSIIPGTILAILTGQFVFAISPITLSLWLNLIRRSDCDCSTYQRIAERDQEAIHRFESISESFRRGRVDFLVNHPEQLKPRDQSQFTKVLADRVEWIEKIRESIALYLHGSANSIAQDLELLKTEYRQQRQQVDELFRQLDLDSNWDPDLMSSIYEQCENLDSRIKTIGLLGSESDFETLRNRLLVLENSCAKHESEPLTTPALKDSELLVHWTPIQHDLSTRLDALAQQYDFNCSQIKDQSLAADAQRLVDQVEGLHRSLSASCSNWENLTREQGFKLQRLQDKLHKVRRILDECLPRGGVDIDGLGRNVAQQCSQLDATKIRVTQALEQVERDVTDLQTFCDTFPRINVSEKIQQSIEHRVEEIQALSIYSMESSSACDRVIDQVEQESKRLLQRINECNHRLHELQALPKNTIADQMVSIKNQLRNLSSEVESALPLPHLQADLGEIDLQLSMLRVKLEEVNTNLNSGLQQLPYLVESQIRNKFSTLKRSPVSKC